MPPVKVVVRSVALLPLAAVMPRRRAAVMPRRRAARRRRVPPVAIVVPPIEVDCRVIGPARRRRCAACRPVTPCRCRAALLCPLPPSVDCRVIWPAHCRRRVLFITFDCCVGIIDERSCVQYIVYNTAVYCSPRFLYYLADLLK